MLDTPGNEWAVNALRVARAWGVPPLTVMANRPNSWREEDSTIGAALLHYEASMVDEYGFPRRESEQGDPEGHYEVKTRFNGARQAMDLWKKSDEAKNLEPGWAPYIVDTRKSS